MKIIPGVHTCCLANNDTSFYACQDKSDLVKVLFSKIYKLTLENKQLKYRSIMKTSTITWRKTKTDAKMKFYTGINTKVLFNKIVRLIEPFLTDMIYWKGPKHAKSFSKVRHQRSNTPNKLSQRYEFLLTLMRLRLELLNEDLAERFGVSSALCSYIFITWIKPLIQALRKTLVVWPSKESIREHVPEIFLKSGCGKCRVIIDCAGVFIERAKSFSAQAATWSVCKHHNAFKFLVGIKATGYISLLSSCYGGLRNPQVYHQR